jgi:hypothetical protein
MDLQSVKFNLPSPSFAGNSYGIKNNARSNYSYFNINLKNILGNLFFKYDYFYLNLIAISSYTAGTGYVTNDDAFININVSGFDFYNYSNFTSNVNSVVMGQFNFDINNNVTKLYDSTNSIVIKASSPENFTLNIYYTRVIDNVIANIPYTNCNFFFELTPVQL